MAGTDKYTKKAMLVDENGDPVDLNISVGDVAIDQGTDGSGAGAGTQVGGTPGSGVRGWLSTIAAIFQNGLGKIRLLAKHTASGDTELVAETDGSLDVTFKNSSLAVTGPLTDTQLRNSAVPVSLASAPSTPVTGTFWQATQPTNLKAKHTSSADTELIAETDGSLDVTLKNTSVAAANILPTADLDITQKITITTAGTPVQGPDKTNAGGWLVSSLATYQTYWMYHGQTAANKGFPIPLGGAPTFVNVADLNSVDFDVATGGSGSIVMASKV